MGNVRFGIPNKEVSFLKNLLNLNLFVEGGSFKGDTAILVSNNFNKVYTIEKSDVMFKIAKENVSSYKNITILKGDSRDHVGKLEYKNEGVLFWLDAHWSGGQTYGEQDECPLLEELDIIFKLNIRCAILIDDARLFLSPPPHPHNIIQWPTLKEIINILPKEWEALVHEDVIYLIPNEAQVPFKKFLQDEITTTFLANEKKRRTIIYKILAKLGII